MEAISAYRHRVVTESDVVFIRQLIAQHSTASRRELSKKLCEAWNWVQANGAPRDMVCRGLMLKLHREGLIELPPVRHVPNNPLASRKRPAAIALAPASLQATLAEIEPILIKEVRRTPDEALFNSLLEQHHYLAYTQPVGEHVKYLVHAKNQPIACLAFSSAPRHLGSRDHFIGWSAEARRRNIRLIAYNTRFLILPWVQVPHLASHLLSRIAKIISADWQRIYHHPIYFLETFIDPERFRGTCYRAANWIRLGLTTGRGKDAPTRQPNRSIKEVLGYPLTKDFRRQLSAME